MKKHIFLLGFISLLLVSCGSDHSSVAVANSSSLENSESSIIDSPLSSEELSSSSQSEPLPAFITQIAEGASSYNGGLSGADILSKAGLSGDITLTQGNLVRLFKAAFEGYMPELTGQRKYGGVYTLPSGAPSDDGTVEEALKWLVSYGLWGEEAFDETAVADEALINTILKRFYMYFGTEEKDDFFASVNHDFLYESSDDSKITDSSYYAKSLMLNSQTVKTNVLAYAKLLADSGDEDASLYKEALDYYEGTLDYSFLDDPLIKTQISYIRTIDSVSDVLSYTANAFSLFGESLFTNIASPSFFYNADYNVVTGIYVNSTSAPFNLDGSSYHEDIVSDTGKMVFSALGLSETDAASFGERFAAFGLRCFNECADAKYDAKRNIQEPLYDVDSSKDIYADNSIDIDLSSVFTSSGYSLTDMAAIQTSDEAEYLALGATLVGASDKELQSLALYELYMANQSAFDYASGTPGTYDNFLNMIENNLAAAYMKSDYYATSLKNLNELFTGIKSVFTERIKDESWLSEEGKTTIKEKIGAVKSTLIGTCSDGTDLGYENLATPSGYTLAATLGAANAALQKGLIQKVALGESFDRILLLMEGPFLSNAFYTPNSNCINITFGAIFSLGFDPSNCTQECVLAKLGFVLGHEFTHGFDTSGVFFDKSGTYTKDGIISKEDMNAFQDLALKAEGLYKDQEVLPGLAQDPSLTVGEDVADIGGVVLMEGLGQEKTDFDFKLFYRELASSFGTKVTRSRFKRVNLNDVHAYGRVRCNVLLSNSALFSSTFGIASGDGMYIPSGDQVVIW